MNKRLVLLKYICSLLALLSVQVVAAQMTVDVDIETPTCNGFNNGSATAVVTNGNAPFRFNWSRSAGNTSTLFNLSAGTYAVTVTDNSGQTAVRTFIVGQPQPLEALIAPIGGACVANATVFVGSAQGGTAPYTYLWRNVATGAVVSGDTLRNPAVNSRYTFEITDANGCSVSRLVQIAAPMTTNVVSRAVSCGGAGDGSADVFVTGGKAPLTYVWSNGSRNPFISGVSGGKYYVTVTDYNGCERIDSAIINEAPVLRPNLTTLGVCTGSATATVAPTGGVAPYGIRWSNGATTPTVSNLAQGIYTVTITDAANCQTEGRVNVSNSANLTLQATATPATCAGLNDGSVTATVTGTALGPFVYNWSNGRTGQTLTGLSAGTYTVTVTDGAGCTNTAMATVTAASNIAFNTVITNALCARTNGQISVNPVTGGTAPYTFRWSNGAVTQTITDLAVGSYRVTVTDATGCARISDSIVVGANAGNVDPVLEATATTCGANNGSARVVSVNAGLAPFTYLWSNGGTTASINNIAPGLYRVTTTDANGCVGIDSVSVGVSARITAAVSSQAAPCGRNGRLELRGNGGTAPYAYRLGNQTNNTGIFTGLNAGVYTVIVTDAQGCADTLSGLRVRDTGSIDATILTPQMVCVGDGSRVRVQFGVNITGNYSGATYDWRFDDGQTANVPDPNLVFSALTANARLIVTSVEGCSDTALLSLPLNVIRVSVVDGLTTCQNVNVSVTAVNNNPNFPVSYRWFPTGLVVSGDTTATPILRGGAAAGTAKVYVAVTNSLGCTYIDSVEVTTISGRLSAADIRVQQDCNTRTIDFTNNSPLAAQYYWAFSANDTASGARVSRTFAAAGNFSLRLIPLLACLDTVDVPFSVREGAAVTVDADSVFNVCVATPLSIRARSNVSVYEWSNTRNFSTILGRDSVLSVSPSNRINVYFVRATDANGCTAIDSVLVNNRAVNVTITPDLALCKNEERQLTVTNLNPTDTLSVRWSPANLLVGSDTTLTPRLKLVANGMIMGRFTNQFGCVFNDTINITVQEVIAEISVANNIVYKGDRIELNAMPLGGGFTYRWSPANCLDDATVQAPILTVCEDSVYTVEVTNRLGCKDTASIVLKVLSPECAEPYIFIPRAFSPNGDNKNDVMYVRGDYLIEVEFVIYNRWGEEVFRTTDKGQGWDGTHRGIPVEPDVYGYYVKGLCRQGEVFFKKGNITVLR